MLEAYPEAYKVIPKSPTKTTINIVLGDSHHCADQYSKKQRELFETYKSYFKNGSKPANHLEGIANISDENLIKNMPASYKRLGLKIKQMLEEIPE